MYQITANELDECTTCTRQLVMDRPSLCNHYFRKRNQDLFLLDTKSSGFVHAGCLAGLKTVVLRASASTSSQRNGIRTY